MDKLVLIERDGVVEQHPLRIPVPQESKIVGVSFGHNPVLVNDKGSDQFRKMGFGHYTCGPARFLFEDFFTGKLRLGELNEYVPQRDEYPVGVIFGIDVMGRVLDVDFMVGFHNDRAAVATFLVHNEVQVARRVVELVMTD